MSKWKMVKIKDDCEKASSNIAQKDICENDGEYPIYGASGFIKTVDFYVQEDEYIGIVKDGAGVGRVMVLPSKSSVTGTIQYIIPNEKVIVRYLANILTNLDLGKLSSGATIPHIYFKNYENIEIPLPPIEEQKRIANILDKASNLIDLRKQQLEQMDLLIKSKFIDMFGDPVTNPNEWQLVPLMETGSCKNGMNFRSNEFGVEIHCLGVGDFKDLSVIEDTYNLLTISLNEMPTSEYLLQDGDIVFVRSNGNKALVGRCLAIYPGRIPTTYSGFCIRYRKSVDNISTKYLLQVFKAPSMRKQIAGRGANIQNLNQQILSQINIPVPPIELQNQFTSFVEQIEKQKAVMQKSLEKMGTNYKALMQEYF